MDASRITQRMTRDVEVAAYLRHLERTRLGLPDSAEDDWFTAEGYVRPWRPFVKTRAYFNYMRRVRSGAPGDATGDWLLAEAEESIRPLRAMFHVA